MTLFLTLMGVGLAGLLLMALPGLSRRGGAHGHLHGAKGHAGHGHLHHLHVHRVGQHAGAARTAGAHAPGHPGMHATGAHGHAGPQAAAAPGAPSGLVELASHLIPEPRALLSLLTLYGASGYVLQAGFHLSHRLSVFLALVPALALELLVVAPLWRFTLRFQGKEAAPLEWLLAETATAVTPFSNGRGIVRVDHDGRVVQLSARLVPEHAGEPVRVGDALRIEDVDTATERVTVSLNPPLTRN